ncbi:MULTISPECIES: hypothetical protein [unclassified Variovorax]|uniref:hypothetical protein n=1 Tax=unclassified Variovorax TaxID=663243 RepID=UPI0008B9B4AD|nr:MULTISPECIES: hypothetical protein [unclassified Variovorax]SEJ43493.1 hypothetical protein SAMN05518853_10224 [Variovorax sp. OK202]SFC41515.1 hypothetical protein SAMN05444746_10224 [Variovorax sp. OK212]
MTQATPLTPHPQATTSTQGATSPPGRQAGTAHRWQFIRAGGTDQVVFRSGEDIARIGELDQKLWVALACPTRGIDFDPRTLDLIDADHDGRVRPPEVVAACEWVCARLRNPDVLLQGSDVLTLGDLDEDTPAGARLHEEARRLLQIQGKPEADTLTLADIADRGELLAAMRFNGDGIVTPDTAQDDAVRAAIAEVMRVHGSVPDRHKATPGIDRARTEAFFGEVQVARDWHVQADAGDRTLMPLGDATLAAADAANKVQAKLDDFFARCRVAAFDAQAVTALNPSPKAYDELGANTLDLQAEPIADLPLAPVTPRCVLPLQGTSLNPAWADAIAVFAARTVVPLLGARDEFSEAFSETDWLAVKQQLAPLQALMAKRPGNWAAELPLDKLDALLAAREPLLALIKDDEAAEEHNALLVDLEKLIRLQRDLVVLLNNFVSFKAFYRREGAIFQAGTLYLDGRSCELTVQVQDTAKHAVLAGLAKTCLAYCDCTRQGQKMSIVAAFTAGDVDFLFVGRNGVFYDRQGRDWDATITKLIENPTSVAQAFFAPYKKFVRVIEEQVAKRAAAQEAAGQTGLTGFATRLTTADQAHAADAAKVPTAVPRPTGRVDVGTVAAIGVALGSISAVLVAIFGKFVDLGQWIPVALLGIVLAISGPSMLIAWLKLRQRSLGPILDASGWAINGRMKVNVRLGGMLSQTARVPPGARRIARDPYRDRHGATGVAAAAVLVLAMVVLAWRMDWLDNRLPAALQHGPTAAAAPVQLHNG